MAIPIVTPDQMRAIDAAAPEPLEELVGRAARAVARAAIAQMGGAYGRRVALIAGPGLNGEDARVAASHLRRRGVRCELFDPATDQIPLVDLVIDGAYGTGLSRSYEAPQTSNPVLAIDIPSGISGLTGEVLGRPLIADETITFAALKPGLVLQPGRSHAGAITVADIGLNVSSARAHLVTDTDLDAWLPTRDLRTHKWNSAVWVVAGSPGMTGAAVLSTRAAMRAGAGYTRLSIPGLATDRSAPIEAVQVPLDRDWSAQVLADEARFGALVVGPGLGRSEATAKQVQRLAAEATCPIVFDADALSALGHPTGLRPDIVLTPHDGEFERLCGHRPDVDRFSAARQLASSSGATVLLKGPTTIVASPDGEALAVTAGDARLATAGTGDVLAGIIGALMAAGLSPQKAAAAGAHWHGRAARLGPSVGLVAGDLPDLLPLARRPREI